MKKIYDISLTLSGETVNWPSDPLFSTVPYKSLEKGDSSNVSVITMGNHFGTHIDPPRHIFSGGNGVDKIPLDSLIGEALVVDAGDGAAIDPAVLRAHDLTGVRRILFKTKNSEYWKRKDTQFHREFVSLTVEAAEYLAEKRMRLVGIDYLSIEAAGMKAHPVHKALLKAGAIIVECLDLSGVPAGRYLLVCAPLKLKDGDGAPSRVFLIEQ